MGAVLGALKFVGSFVIYVLAAESHQTTGTMSPNAPALSHLLYIVECEGRGQVVIQAG